MMNGLNSKQKIALIFLGVLVFAGGGYFLKSREPDFAAPVDVGNIFDWNLYDGPLVADFTSLVAEPLMTKSPEGYYISRIANRIEYKDGAGVIGIREAVYWSDGVRVTVDQVLAALDRRQRNSALATSPNTEAITKAIASAKFTRSGENEIKFSGFGSEAEAYAVFTSLASGPIREDLLKKKKDEAWRVTVGAYYPAELRDRFFPNDTITLEPNQYYYQGKKPAPLVLKLHGVFLRAKSDAEGAKDGRSS